MHRLGYPKYRMLFIMYFLKYRCIVLYARAHPRITLIDSVKGVLYPT